MKTTKKLLILSLIAVIAMVAVMPSTFSWYAHDGEDHYQGNEIDYQKTDLPLSLKQSNGVSMTTSLADAYGKKTTTALGDGGGSVASGKTQNYITTITNNGTKPVSVDLSMSEITNNAHVFVGTADPVVNEKSYAARAKLEKVDWDYEVIYFEPRTHYDWWKQGVRDSQTHVGSAYRDEQGIVFGEDNVTDHYDMNLEYQIGTSGFPMAMQKCPGTDTVGNASYNVYRAFVTTEADSLFFFNHYYIEENANLEWNRTPTVTDFAEGRVYYLNGSTNDYNNKAISSYDNFNDTNICVYYYYKSATMAAGRTADLSLKKGTSDMISHREEFDYTGKTIFYSSNSGYITVSKDGLVTAKDNAAGRTAKITTTIEGEFGDEVVFETSVKVPQTIDQVPVVQNISVPAGESVDVAWYVKNESAAAATFSNVFCNT